MADEFTGGSFEELRRETEALRRDAEKLRKVEQGAATNIEQDEAARKRLAERARTATSRSIAQAETIIDTASSRAGIGTKEGTTGVRTEAQAIDRYTVSARNAQASLSRLRQTGPLPFANTKNVDVLKQQVAQMERLQLLQRTFVTQPNARAGASALSRANNIAGPAAATLVPPVGEQPTVAALGARATAAQRAATAHAVLNAQMQRHGALSTEFLQQLARGNVGLRELGTQLVSTAGKFGGWLAAGAGVFALIGTFGAVAKGATDASSGVNQLQRVISNVDPDVAQQGFRDLSEQFNLPITDVTDAVYQMGKVFHDTNDALEASKSVLYAVKVGELDVATASRYLISITKGFALSSKEQITVFDQVNAAQNKYGISIQSLLAGTAKAAGSFRLAGGDATDLIAIITTLAQATGQTGESIGTALQRSPHFIATDKSQETLKNLGIDPSQDIDQIYKDAIDKAEKIGPAKQRELAEALFGSQYGSRTGAALLQQGDLLKQVYKDVSPSASAGSAQTELERTLGSIDERISKIGIELGVLGSNLASSGILDGFGALLQIVTLLLQGTNDLVDVFNLLPGPLRHTLVIMAELYALFRLMRRFDIGSTLPGAAGRAFTNPRNDQNKLREQSVVRQNQLNEALIGASNDTARAELDRTVAQSQLLDHARRENAVVRDGSRVIQQSVGNASRTIQLRDALAEHDQRIAQSHLRESIVAQQLAKAAEDEARYRRFPTNVTDRTGEFANTADPLVRTPQRSGGAQNVLRYIDDVQTNLTPLRTNVARATRTLQANIQQVGVVRGTLNTGLQGAQAAASRLRSASAGVNLSALRGRLQRGATNLRQMGAGIAAAITPLDVGILGLVTIASAIASARSKASDLAKVKADLSNPESPDSIDSDFQSVVDQIDSETIMDDLIGGFNNNREDQAAAIDLYNKQQGKITDFKSAIERTAQGKPLAAQERVALKEGTFTEVYEQIAQDVSKRIEQGRLTVEQGDKIIDRLVKSARKSPLVDDPASLIQTLRQQGTGDTAEANVDAIKQRAAIAAAKGPLYDDTGAARNARDTARKVLQTLRKQGGTGDDIRSAEQDVAEAERAYRQSLDDRAKALLEARGQVAVSEINPDAPVARARQAATNAKRSLEQARAQGRDRSTILQGIAAVNDAENAVRDAIRERMLGFVDVAQSMQEANAPLYAPLVSEQAAVVAAKAKLAILQKTGAGRLTIAQQMAEVAGAERALQLAANDRAKDLLDAQGAVALAQIDPQNSVATARQTVTNARSVYNLVVAQGRDQSEVMQAYAAVLQAESALKEAIEQRAAAIAQGKFDIQAAKAEASGNDVRAAAVAVRDALYDLNHADTREETLQARKSLIDARAQKRDAIFNTEVEDIQFSADIGKLTIQQQIAAYQRLLKTLQLNRDQRRDLRKRIYDLKQEADQATGDFNIDVGNIRLPTLYEIRRAIQGGAGAPPRVAFSQTNHYNATGANADEIVGKIRKQEQDAANRNKNMARSAGII